jgi:hypothetical protein
VRSRTYQKQSSKSQAPRSPRNQKEKKYQAKALSLLEGKENQDNHPRTKSCQRLSKDLKTSVRASETQSSKTQPLSYKSENTTVQCVKEQEESHSSTPSRSKNPPIQYNSYPGTLDQPILSENNLLFKVYFFLFSISSGKRTVLFLSKQKTGYIYLGTQLFKSRPLLTTTRSRRSKNLDPQRL